MLTVLIILLILCLLWLLALKGRTGHTGLDDLRGWRYAHRGLHGEGRPENSPAAFRAAVENGYGIELDVHLLKDGTLAVIHDSLLSRTTGLEGRIEDLTREQLSGCFLEGTEETVPTFRQVLSIVDGKTPLIVELKVINNNYAALCQAVCQCLDSYTGLFCLESFDPRCLLWLKKHRPELIRGQLARNFFRAKEKIPFILQLVMTCQLLNFLTRPDFVAFRFLDRKRLGNHIVRKLWRMQGVGWTIRTQEELQAALKEGWLPIFENITP